MGVASLFIYLFVCLCTYAAFRLICVCVLLPFYLLFILALVYGQSCDVAMVTAQALPAPTASDGTRSPNRYLSQLLTSNSMQFSFIASLIAPYRPFQQSSCSIFGQSIQFHFNYSRKQPVHLKQLPTDCSLTFSSSSISSFEIP